MKRLIATGLVLWGVVSPAHTIHADVVLLSPPPPPGPPRAGENFAESRFGAPPTFPDVFDPGAESALEAHEDEADDPSISGKSQKTGRGLASEGAAKTPLQASVQAQAQVNETPSTALVRNGTQEIALIAGDLGYFPKTIFVTRDIPVRMYVTGASKKPLCLMMDSFQVRKQLRSQKIEEISFVPSTPGKYRFYCPINGMEGTLLVKE